MSVICSQCKQANVDDATFCKICGVKLQPTNALRGFNQANTSPPPFNSYASQMPGSSSGQMHMPSFTSPAPQHGQPGFPTANLSQQTPGAQPVVLPPSESMGSLRRAFAGYGTVITHHSWLINGRKEQAGSVRSEVEETAKQHNLEDTEITLQKDVIDQSLQSERRSYVKIKRKIATIFVYVTPTGHDLYISRTTAVRPAISTLRTLILALILAYLFVVPFAISAMIASTIASASAVPSTSSGYGPTSSSSAYRSTSAPSSTPSILTGAGILIIILAVVYFLSYAPTFFFLLFCILRSIIAFFVEKDLWIYLRPNILSDFHRDDVALLEHVTDDVIRDAVKRLGLDADKIIPPGQGYQPKQRIRLI